MFKRMGISWLLRSAKNVCSECVQHETISIQNSLGAYTFFDNIHSFETSTRVVEVFLSCVLLTQQVFFTQIVFNSDMSSASMTGQVVIPWLKFWSDVVTVLALGHVVNML